MFNNQEIIINTMRKSNNKNKNYIPEDLILYGLGSWLNDKGKEGWNMTTDVAKTAVDIPLSGIPGGANVIRSKDYKSGMGKNLNKYAGINLVGDLGTAFWDTSAGSMGVNKQFGESDYETRFGKDWITPKADKYSEQGGQAAGSILTGIFLKNPQAGKSMMQGQQGLFGGAEDRAAAEEQAAKDRLLRERIARAEGFNPDYSGNVPVYCYGGKMKRLADGGTMPESDPYYQGFQESLNTNKPTIQDKARLYYYTQKLNKSLREKNPTLYDKLYSEYGYNKEKLLTTKTRTEGADKYAKENPDFYLSPEEQKKFLAEDEYKDYISLRGKYGAEYNLLGEGDNPNDPTSWKVGARHATAFNPVKHTYTYKPPKNSFDSQTREFVYDINYDPTSPEKYTGKTGFRKYANGGAIINYEGQTHDGKDGGIPVDKQGNPITLSKNKPVALTENKEVTWLSPDNEDPYVFSDKLGFAKKANSFINKYKMRLGGKLDGYDPLAWKGLNESLTKLAENQEQVREQKVNKISNKINKYQKEMGSYLNLVRREDGGNIYGDEPLTGAMNGFLEYYNGGGIEDGTELKNKYYAEPYDLLSSWNFYPGEIKSKGIIQSMAMPNSTTSPKVNVSSKAPITTPVSVRDNVDYSAEYRPTSLSSSGVTSSSPSLDTQLVSGMNTSLGKNAYTSTFPSGSETKSFQGNVSPWGMIGTMAGNALLMATDRKPEEVRLPRSYAEKINLSGQRNIARENFANARANLINRLKNAGLSPSQYTQALASGTADLMTGANQAVGASLEEETLRNIQERNRVRDLNAQVGGQEAMYNAEALKPWQSRRQQYLSAMVNAPVQYMSEKQRANQLYDTLGNTGNVDYYEEPGTTAWQRFLGRAKFNIRPRQ